MIDLIFVFLGFTFMKIFIVDYDKNKILCFCFMTFTSIFFFFIEKKKYETAKV